MSKQKSTIVGVVKSISPKSLVVEVSRKEKNWLGKYVSKKSKMHVHDEKSEAVVGDLVSMTASRPYSKQKTWKLFEVLLKAEKTDHKEAV